MDGREGDGRETERKKRKAREKTGMGRGGYAVRDGRNEGKRTEKRDTTKGREGVLYCTLP